MRPQAAGVTAAIARPRGTGHGPRQLRRSDCGLRPHLHLPVVARHRQRFCTLRLALRQIAPALFDVAGDGVIIPAARDGPDDIPVLGLQPDGASRVQPLKADAAAVVDERRLLLHAQRREHDVLVGGGDGQLIQPALRQPQRNRAHPGLRLAADEVHPCLCACIQRHHKVPALVHAKAVTLLPAFKRLDAQRPVLGGQHLHPPVPHVDAHRPHVLRLIAHRLKGLVRSGRRHAKRQRRKGGQNRCPAFPYHKKPPQNACRTRLALGQASCYPKHKPLCCTKVNRRRKLF